VSLRRPRFIFLFCLFIIPFPAFAGDFDGSKSLSGSVDKILEIYPSRISNDADPETVGLPQKFFIISDSILIIRSFRSGSKVRGK